MFLSVNVFILTYAVIIMCGPFALQITNHIENISLMAPYDCSLINLYIMLFKIWPLSGRATPEFIHSHVDSSWLKSTSKLSGMSKEERSVVSIDKRLNSFHLLCTDTECKQNVPFHIDYQKGLLRVHCILTSVAGCTLFNLYNAI